MTMVDMAVVDSSTTEYRTPEGKVRVTVAQGPMYWVGVHCGKHGTQAMVIGDRLGAVCGLALRGGVPPQKLVAALVDTKHERSGADRNGCHNAFSIPDAIGLALRQELLL